MDINLQLPLIGAVLALPALYALWRAPSGTRDDFIFNSGRTGFWGTLAGIVCGNIGIGTFVAIMLFSAASPVIGVSLAFAYTLGLVICAIIAPNVHALSERHGVRGLIDLIVVTHRIQQPLLVWLPIAFVFLLRATVQLLALAAILMTILPVSQLAAVGLAALCAGAYTAIGGYRVATETDVVQSLIIVAGIALLTFANLGAVPQTGPFFDLGPYRLPLLIGVWLFIPVSAVLAVDNWQRMATARDPQVARRAFLAGAPLCLLCYLGIVWLGLGGAVEGAITSGLHALVPAAHGWIVDLMLIAVVMSTMDTFVMPLMTGLERTTLPLRQLQLMVVAVFAGMALIGALFGDLLSSIIAAFSSLAVFLPTVLAAVLGHRVSATAAILSLNAGVIVTLLLLTVDQNSAALVGCAFAAMVYAFTAYLTGSRRAIAG